MEKINIAELLKNCPQGMELDCSMFKDVVFDKITDNKIFPICVKRIDGYPVTLTKYGGYANCPSSKCVIFPKGKTTWEGFVPPCKFKDGDIISDSIGICIFKGEGKIKGTVDYYCGIPFQDFNVKNFNIKNDNQNSNCHYGYIANYKFATEEEKEKLFQVITDNNYRWDEETKTLKKLVDFRFKNGDIIYVKDKYGREWCSILDKCKNDKLYSCADICINDNKLYYGTSRLLCNCKDIIEYRLATEKEKEKLFQTIEDNNFKRYELVFDYNTQCCDIKNHIIEEENGKEENKTLKELIEPKFKVGNKIKHKTHISQGDIVTEIKDTHYILDDGSALPFTFQDEYELAPNKFDINTLIPFESKVLVRDSDIERWRPTIWGFYDTDDEMNYPYECIGDAFAQCIPFKNNEHLLGTNNDCDDFYKNWK